MTPLHPERSAVSLTVGKSRDWGLGRETPKAMSPGYLPRGPAAALGLRTADTDPELRGGVFLVPL